MPSEGAPEVLVLAFSDLSSDPRVQRQANWLANAATLTLAGFAERAVCEPGEVTTQRTASSPSKKLARGLMLLARRHEAELYTAQHVRGLREGLVGRRFDLVVANDVVSLPLAFEVAAGAPVVLDAHEFAPGQGEERWVWRVLWRPRMVAWCREYLPRLAGMVTVSEGVAREYWREFGVRPVVVRNAPAYEDLQPSQVDLDRVRLVHHGVAAPGRHPELMLELMGLLDERFSLDLMFAGSDPGYLRRLQRQAAGVRGVRFVPPVPTTEIAGTINRYDLGLFLLPPVNTNYANALPNKFFEFVQGRLGVAIGPTSDMARLTEQYGLGVVGEDFTPASLAERLNALTADDVREYKRNAHTAARHLNADHEAQHLLDLIHRVLAPA